MVHINNTHEEEEFVAEDENLSEELEMDSGDVEESMQNKLKSLRAKLAICEEEKKKYLDDLQRTRADFLNSKRRLEEQLARDKERATDKILVDLLSLIDSFDTAMADTNLWATIDEKWRKGVEAIYANLLSILKSNNVVPLESLGNQFNPEEHEAVSNSTVTEDADIDTVTAVLQKGFKRNDTIIRHAKVVVGTR